MNMLCTLRDARSDASTETTITKIKSKEKSMIEETDCEFRYVKVVNC